jgi:tRNA A-37 threonylcarbamoyl transferase component Bud32
VSERGRSDDDDVAIARTQADMLGATIQSGPGGDGIGQGATRSLAESARARAPGALFGPGATLAGRYRIVRLLGAGGMGQVYEAMDEELRVRVALKTLRPELVTDPVALERFRREVHLARRITHPGICRIFDVARHGELTFLTMEFLDGETLEAALKREGRFEPARAEVIAAELAAGLDAAHDAGVVHRDFKSQNVLMVGGRAVITDFGLARATDDADEGDSRLTHGGQMVGTPAYIAPEQLLGETMTPRTDVYSFGVVLYELVTGKLPFLADTAMKTATMRLTSAPEPPHVHAPDLPAQWDAVILRCLAREPADRFARAGEAVRALSEPVAPAPAPSVAVATAVEPASPRRRPRWPLVAAVVVLGGGGAVALTATRGGDVPVYAGLSAGELPPPPMTQRWLTESGPRHLIRDIALSADGKTLAYVQGTRGHVMIRPLDGEARRITMPLDPDTDAASTREASNVSWFPDGRLLVTQGANRGALWIVDPARPEAATRFQPEVSSGAVSADGRHIAFVGGNAIWVADVEGSGHGARPVHRLPREAIVLKLDWSPDGQALIWVRKLDDDAPPVIEVGAADGRWQRTLGEPLVLDEDYSAPVAVTGTEILYAMPGGDGAVLRASRLEPATGAVGEPRTVRQITGGRLRTLDASAGGDMLVFTAIDEQHAFESLSIARDGTAGEPRRLSIDLDAATLFGVWFGSDGALLLNALDGWYGQSLGDTQSTPVLLDSLADSVQRLGDGGLLYWRIVESERRAELVRCDAAAQQPDGRCATAVVLSELMLRDADRVPSLPCSRQRCVATIHEDSGVEFRAVSPSSGLGERLASLADVDPPRGAWSLSPDGGTAAFVWPGRGVTLVPLDGRPFRVFEPPKETALVQALSWSADGHAVFVTGMYFDAGVYGIARMDRGGRWTILYETDDRWMSQPSASPDGKNLLFRSMAHTSRIGMFGRPPASR